ncbi:putative disease resistance protein RGA3 isoform X2 [Oryza brachyantha]|uniref:putative disease resistance protein RGA3 isoform X2 n=1 Tax=Oryza brachyantha TaxID=4533 RepID=UPI0003EA9712|nr:putative disease resistance protein RGA3 isoform X2 [Oryza brachyantha]
MAIGLVPSLLSSASSLLAILRSRPSALHPPTASADLQRLERLLSRIQATVDDAEEQEVQDNYAKLWLKELKELAHDAKDVLEDYRYELLRCKVQERQADYPRKRKHIDYDQEDDDSINETINDIANRFEEIFRDRAALQLRSEDAEKLADRSDRLNSKPTTHLLDESLVFGRIDEKENIVESMLSQSMNPGIVVLPIVGMGGIGKTTVAQMVYNDGRVRKHFDHSGWIHVSPTFDVLRLMTAITESLTKRNCGFTQLSLIHEVLLKELVGKKLFFVLDDVWNECESSWHDLIYPLRYAQTVTILVTTRSKEVAHLVETMKPFNLGAIPNDDSWQLFQYYAFGMQCVNEKSSLAQIGRKILQKCGGLPLAVKSVGCLLRSKRDEYTWMEILESELWELDDKDNIFPALRLSYYRLPTRLKPCFLLCSLYPTYLGFTKDEIIDLWIAQGYVDSKSGKTRQEVGNEYFNELYERSLIETSSGQLLCEAHYFDELLGRSVIESLYENIERPRNIGLKSYRSPLQFVPWMDPTKSFISEHVGNFHLRKYIDMKQSLIETYLEQSSESIQRFKLHDAIFDLAKSFTSRERCTAVFHTLCNLPNELHQLHASQASRTLSFHEPRSLQTLVLNCCFSASFNELSSFVYLRALVLNSNQDVTNMIGSIGNLKHLRYLSLNCYLQELPESVSRLYSLETLVISNLRTLRATNFHNLVSLRSLHVYFEFLDGSLDQICKLDMLDTVCLKRCSNITYLPLHVGSLIKLQRLQLIEIPNIRILDNASFKYRRINSITRHPEATFPSLEELELIKLCKLEDWYGIQHSDCPKLQRLTIRNCVKLRTVPCFVSLRKLVISNCALTILPFSVGNIPSKLQTIDIRDCTYLSTLVGLQNLSYLISLYIARCPRLLIPPSENMLCKPHNAFIADCPKLKQWCEKHEFNYFQVTRKMQISDVRLITDYGVENFSTVEHLTIQQCSEMDPTMLSSTEKWLPSNLRFLHLSCSTFSGVLQFHMGLQTLSRLEIWSCTKLQSLVGLHKLDDLRRLVLVDCPLLELPTETEFPKRLSSLVIRGCHQLLSLHLGMNDPTILRELEISDCRGLMYIGWLGYYTDIESLKLFHCPLLQLQDFVRVVPETALICCCPRLKKWCEWNGIEYKENPEDSVGKL